MKVRTFKDLQGGLYRVTIFTEDFSGDELRRIGDQGDPEVDVGGSFGTESDTNFTIPSKKVLLKSGFEHGFIKSFDHADSAQARDFADLWATEVRSRIFDEMQSLKNNDVTNFEGESVQSMIYS